MYEDRSDERLKNKSGGIYTTRIHCVVTFLLSYILGYVSLTELVNVCQVFGKEHGQIVLYCL
jgi:hypothetical protein